MTGKDWLDWHADYADPTSTLSRRLDAVRARIGEALDEAPPGPVRVLSLCAGQGRDLLDVLPGHPRRQDVRALLVELDPRNVAAAEQAAAAAGLTGVEVRQGDAALLGQYADLAPAELVLVCGVYGNISDDDVARTIGCCAQLTAAGGTVIWTRHRQPPDLVPQICQWYDEHGFALHWLSDPALPYGVGVHRFAGQPQPLTPATRMFTFLR